MVGPEESAKAGQLFSPTVHTAFPNKGIVILIGVSPLLEWAAAKGLLLFLLFLFFESKIEH